MVSRILLAYIKVYIIIIYAPTIHLLPGSREISLVVMAEQTKVQMAMNGIARTVAIASLSIATVDHIYSQNMCIRYIP